MSDLLFDLMSQRCIYLNELFMKAKIKLASKPLRSPGLKQDNIHLSVKQIVPTISQICLFVSKMQVGASGPGVTGICNYICLSV